MGFVWHEPRKRSSSSEPRVVIAKKFISLNPPCIEKYFKDKDYVKIGHDKQGGKLIFVPVSKDDRQGLKVIANPHSLQRYINAAKLFKNLSVNLKERTEYRCTWDEANKGVIVDLEKDKVK